MFKHTGNYRGDVGARDNSGHDAGALRRADLGAVHGLAGVRAGRRLRRPGARVLHIRSVHRAAGPGPALAGRRLGRAGPAGALLSLAGEVQGGVDSLAKQLAALRATSDAEDEQLLDGFLALTAKLQS